VLLAVALEFFDAAEDVWHRKGTTCPSLTIAHIGSEFKIFLQFGCTLPGIHPDKRSYCGSASSEILRASAALPSAADG
jgi:hypothetical protein